MKKTSVITIATLLLQLLLGHASAQVSHRSNFIDCIDSSKQIIDIIRKADGRYKDFKENVNLEYAKSAKKGITDSLRNKSWVKADFDRNGLTDLLVMGNLDGDAILCV